MKYYINVAFSNNKKTYYFSTDDETIHAGSNVIVETSVGKEIGCVEGDKKDLSTLNFDMEIKPIIRKATPFDLETAKQNKRYSLEAKKVFNKEVTRLNLDMNLIDAQYTFDRKKVLFTYVANERVDFRELLRSLATELHARIELKQINARERAQDIGGIGVCGLPLCCTTFLNEFEGVSLNKAKNQMLSINIPKLSGQCGKLMCCLKYEDDLYTEEKKNFPKIGMPIKYEGNIYKITGFNILSKMVKIQNINDVEYISLENVNKLLKK